MANLRVTDETGGKYYSTKLDVTLPDGRKVWVELSSNDEEPSTWEIANRWEDRAEFDRERSDGHYERAATRIVADHILSWNHDA